MRKYQQNQILDIIETLKVANKELERQLIRKKPMSTLQLLEDCQKGVVQVGEFIETIQGEGTESVALLEDYHEILYYIGETIENISTDAIKHLQKKLHQIENSVKKELSPDKIEVVFFPYKASMWDSLESIYFAAKEDPACDVYCVPIPYFDKNPNGSLRQMHYEGTEYPDNIEITSWESYDLKSRHPDVIYIHNPYDDWNSVTSVHPDFYAQKIKDYTDKLVYIPYFVLQEISPDDQAAVDGMKHFCFLPGTIYADEVIVQSERMKKIYVNEFLKEAKKNNLQVKKNELELKFKGLGSPKIDKVYNTKPDNFEVPQKWLEIIKKPDGSWKKIAFYNTGLAALLKHNEVWVKKIEDVLDRFKKNQDDVVLLWRPHPLIEDTMRSMRPVVLEKYLKLKSNYINENWGIYDDTPNLSRAVTISDVYYGDESSVVRLFQEASKPAIIQQVVSAPLCIDFFECVGNEIFFMSADYNCLYCHNIERNNTISIGALPVKGSGEYRLFGNCVAAEEKLFFSPVKSGDIIVYDILSKKNIVLPLDKKKAHNDFRCFNAVRYCDFIYFISTAFQALIIKLDIHTLKIEYIEYNAPVKTKECEFIARECVIVKNTLFMVMLEKPIIVEYLLDEDQFIYHSLSMLDGAGTISYINNEFYLSGKQCIYKWNKDGNTLKEFRKFPLNYGVQIIDDNGNISNDKFDDEGLIWKYPFYKSFVIGHYVLFISKFVNMSVMFNTLTNEILEYQISENENINSILDNNGKSIWKYSAAVIDQKGRVFLYSTRDSLIYYVNIHDNIINGIKLDIQYTIENIENEMRRNSGVIYERQDFNSINSIATLISTAQKQKKVTSIEKFGDLIYLESGRK